MADDANAEDDYDAEEGDDDTEESLDGGDADVDDESPAAPAQPQQPPRSIMKTIFGRLLGRRTSEVGSLTNCHDSADLTCTEQGAGFWIEGSHQRLQDIWNFRGPIIVNLAVYFQGFLQMPKIRPREGPGA